MIVITKENVTEKLINDLIKTEEYTSPPFLLKTKWGVYQYKITTSNGSLSVLRPAQSYESPCVITMPGDTNNLVHGSVNEIVTIIKEESYDRYSTN